MAIEIKQEQGLKLTQGQRQSLDMLALTNQELEGYLTEEYLENPLLECTVDKQADMMSSLDRFYEKSATFQDHYLQWEGLGADVFEESDRRGDMRDKAGDAIDGQILSQLDAEAYSAKEWGLIRFLIQCLDEKGFFPYSAEDIASRAGCSKRMVERCLTDLRGLEPTGIFAKDLSDCLIMQLDAQGLYDEALRKLIRGYMPDVLAGRLSNVTRKLRISTAQAREYIRLIGALNPRPIMNLSQDETQYIIPDVIATYENGAWQVFLNDRWMGEYRLDDYYLRMMQEAEDPELKTYFKDRLQRAHFLIEAVERRRRTIVKIAETICDLQEPYFLRGGELQPMTLDDVAARTGVHPSTVSRAIKGKYLQYKRPALMRELFSNTTMEATADAVRRAISEVVAAENGEKPLSDCQIVEALTARGMDVSRRTVAKYRTQMGIPDSRQRARM